MVTIGSGGMRKYLKNREEALAARESFERSSEQRIPLSALPKPGHNRIRPELREHDEAAHPLLRIPNLQ